MTLNAVIDLMQAVTLLWLVWREVQRGKQTRRYKMALNALYGRAIHTQAVATPLEEEREP